MYGERRRHKGGSPRTVLTAAGHITLSRVYFTYNACSTGEYALDFRLGITGARWRIRRVNRMAGLCSVMYSNQWNAYWNTLAS